MQWNVFTRSAVAAEDHPFFTEGEGGAEEYFCIYLRQVNINEKRIIYFQWQFRVMD